MEGKIWHKSYAPGVPKTLTFEKTTISQALSRTAARYPDHVALSYLSRNITYAELDDLVSRFADALFDLGVRKGDKVAMCLPNIPQVIISNLATFRIGAVAVQNNPLYTEEELAHQLGDSDSKVVITLSLLVPRMEKVLPRTKLEKIIACHIHTFLSFPKRQIFPFLKKDMYRKIKTTDTVKVFKDLIKKPVGPIQDQSQWDELAALIYTGGTTGVSKGVMLSHANISSNVQQFIAWFPDLKPGEEALIGTFPIFHSAGFTAIQNFMIWQGYRHIMIPRPEPKGLIGLMKKEKPTFLPGVPTIFIGLLNEPAFREMDFSNIKGFFSGAAPLAADTIRDLKEVTGAIMCEVYGLTETSPIASITPWGGEVKAGTVGVPVPDTDIKIMDLETGIKELPTGERGEVTIHGPQVMMGYYKKPEETAAVLRDGTFYTGDIGCFDEDGYLKIVDRKKDMVIAGGYNIYPVEIDDVLIAHPKVLEACAVGVPDAYRGETIKAFVVLKKGEELSIEELEAYCKEKLAAYKIPKSFEFIDELPKSVVGKVLRRTLREMEIERGSK